MKCTILLTDGEAPVATPLAEYLDRPGRVARDVPRERGLFEPEGN